MSFAFRELNLRMQLENDEFVLKKDQLSNDRAQRQGGRRDMTRIAVDIAGNSRRRSAPRTSVTAKHSRN
jgi:hypothetical protein